MVDPDPDPDEHELVERIVAWRVAGWSFQEIGAELEREGFDPKDPEHWEQQVLRHLVRQRERP